MGKRQDAAKHARVDGNRGCREPTAGEHLGEQSAGRVPHHGGLFSSLPITSAVVATCFSVFLARASGFAAPLQPFSDRPAWRQRRVTGLLEEVRPVGPATRQQPEAVDEDDRVVPEAFAASISLLSRSEMDAMPNSSRSQWKSIRP